MLFIGFQGSDNVWLAMAPRNALRSSSEDVPVSTCSGPTTMEHRHYLMLVAWLAGMMHKKGIYDVYLSTPYPDIESTATLGDSTNIL
jgi:hypothetical protein